MQETRAAGRTALEQLKDEDLIAQLPIQGTPEPSDEERAVMEELWIRHSETVRQYLRKKVFCQHSLCPESEDRDHFFETSFSDTYVKYLHCVRRQPEPIRNFVGLLCTVACSVALDLRRRITGLRTSTGGGTVRKKRIFVPYDATRDISEQIAPGTAGTFPLRPKLDHPFHTLASHERKLVVRELLTQHAKKSDRDMRSAKILRWRFWKEWSVRQIADYIFGDKPAMPDTTDQAIRRTIAGDCRKLRDLLEAEFHIKRFEQL